MSACSQYYQTHPLRHHAQKRGSLVAEGIGILPSFRGVAVHDGLTAYGAYEQCKSTRFVQCPSSQRANVHRRREHEQQWAGQMKALLMEIEEAVREEAARGGKRLASETTRDFERRYQRVLKERGLQQTLPPSERVREGGPNRVKARIWWTGWISIEGRCSGLCTTSGYRLTTTRPSGILG